MLHGKQKIKNKKLFLPSIFLMVQINIYLEELRHILLSYAIVTNTTVQKIFSFRLDTEIYFMSS